MLKNKKQLFEKWKRSILKEHDQTIYVCIELALGTLLETVLIKYQVPSASGSRNYTENYSPSRI